MKTVITLSLCVVLLSFSCKNETTPTATPTPETIVEKVSSRTPLEGTWELVSYYNYVNDKIQDSSLASKDHRQVKMFTKEHVMWSKKRPIDSTEWFAYGDYKIEGNKLIEHLEYGSKTMMPIILERDDFIYELHQDNPNRFSQIELDDEGHRIYSENYMRLD